MEKITSDLNLKFQTLLQEEFSRRLRVNSRYSIRAFANHINIDSSTLSQILSGKRRLSNKKIKEISTKIGLPLLTEEKSQPEYSQLTVDHFASVADWYHFAILDLTLIKSFKNDSEWIAYKLGITVIEVTTAIDRMKRLGLLINHDGKLTKAQAFYTNYTEGVTSAALKEYQRQVIQKALLAVDNVTAERKDITSMTIAVNSKKLKEAKQKIKEFRRELCDFLEEGEKDSVFHFTAQLYPVTEIEN